MIAWLLACAAPDPVVIGGAHTELTITLVNPTTCDTCDPFHDVDTLRVDVTVNGEVVATDSFAYPGEAPTLPDLEGLGVVRVEMVGLGGGRALSAGRTPEITLIPDQAQTVPMLFLPANRALPLTSEMLAQRSRHVAVLLRDGRVLLIGGQDPGASRTFVTTELFDPAEFVYTPHTAALAVGAVDPRVVWTAEDDLLIVGGHALTDRGEIPLGDASLYDGDTADIAVVSALTVARDGHCFAFFRERQGLVLGGSADTNAGDYVKPDEATGSWAFTNLPMRDFEQADVTGCATLGEDRLFVQGLDAASTGLWANTEGGDLSESFHRVSEGSAGDVLYVSGAMIVPLSDGTAWIGGGAEQATGLAATRVFDPAVMRFADAGPLSRPRFDGRWAPWIREGWIAAGCGWEDTDRAVSASSVELVDLAGTEGSLTELDRDRPGCALTVLRDGAVLVTGGYARGDEAAVASAILVPLPGEE